MKEPEGTRVSMIAQLLRGVFILERRMYPLAEIQDYYKLMFQAAFGPAHWFPAGDSGAVQRAAEAIHREMADCEGDHRYPYIQDISVDQPMVRCHFCGSRDTGLTPAVIADAFINGSAGFRPCSRDQFQYWAVVFRNLLAEPPFHFSPADLDEFCSAIRAAAYPAVHHSESFRSRYRPKYRVVPGKALKTSAQSAGLNMRGFSILTQNQ